MAKENKEEASFIKIVKYIESKNGVLKIYSDNSFKIIFGENNKSFIDNFYRTHSKIYSQKQEVKEELNKYFEGGPQKFVENLFFRSKIISWAKEQAFNLIGNDREKVSDIFVGIVSVPIFNASVKSLEGAILNCSALFYVYLNVFQ